MQLRHHSTLNMSLFWARLEPSALALISMGALHGLLSALVANLYHAGRMQSAIVLAGRPPLPVSNITCYARSHIHTLQGFVILKQHPLSCGLSQ